ncbi:hypothetical protein CAPI_01330 [Corynebacterium capitovis DSM 44611]|uniref:hypothetical protein n=1 Tax=Corynebacterium capitovis TaxID=131081 RepID=UPI00036BC7D9|nr:hypothetical protein [Corynebacterium capitovis]WKD56840.1 hypothetical protein CAPI_01330 [Corynebacterium capitovis DSM 44611]
MTRRLSIIDRILVALLGLLLLLAGLVPVFYRFDFPYNPGISEALRGADRAQLADVSARPWFPYALTAASLLFAVAGTWVIVANIRSRAFSMRSVGQGETGPEEIQVNVQRVADAACAHLQLSPAVVKVAKTTAWERSRPTTTFTVTADPDVGLGEIVALLEDADRDFRAACAGLDIDAVYKLHFDRLDSVGASTTTPE